MTFSNVTFFTTAVPWDMPARVELQTCRLGAVNHGRSIYVNIRDNVGCPGLAP